MLVSPPNSYVDFSAPSEMTLGGRASGKWLGHKGGALMNGIRALIRRDKRACSSSQLSTM